MNLIVMAVLALVLFMPSWAQAMTFDRIVVFGGSMSDSGNVFALNGGVANHPPYDQSELIDSQTLVPNAPYDVGGHHFSNGATWIEQFARPLDLGGSVRPAFATSNVEGTDYAVGGARAGESSPGYNMSEQVAVFLQDFTGVAPSDALYVIDFGGNDIRDALVAASEGKDPFTVLQPALTSIASNMSLLLAAGARKFLVLNVADIGKIPSVLIAGQAVSAFATTLSIVFNTQLEAITSGFGPGVEIATFDVFGTVDSVIEAVIKNGEAFGFTNATEACVEPNIAPFKCDAPDQYLFWDGIHPTKAGHAFLSQAAADLLNPIIAKK